MFINREKLSSGGGKIVILLLYLSTVMTACSENEGPFKNSFIKSGKRGIILTDRTSMRVDPFLYSSRISQLRKGDTVEVVDCSKQKAWIGNIQKFWYKVKLSKGIVGWVYGRNIKVFSGNNDEIIEVFISNFWEEESEKMSGHLAGVWWSINGSGNFTDHCLEIYKNGKYISYRKGGEKIEGEFNFSFRDKEILFLNGTSFEHNLNYIQRGKAYLLKKVLKNREIKFWKISKKTK